MTRKKLLTVAVGDPLVLEAFLAARLALRHVPELHFEQDRHPDVESRIELLLKRARKTTGRDAE